MPVIGRRSVRSRVIGLGLVLGMAMIAGGPAPTRAQEAAVVDAELKAQQGVWQVVAFVRDGQATEPETVAGITRTVEGDRAVWRREGKSFAGTRLVLDATASPRQIDVIPEGGRNQGERVPGIYKLDGDALTLCMADPGAPRPTEFTAEPGSRRTLMTFRRSPRSPAGDR